MRDFGSAEDRNGSFTTGTSRPQVEPCPLCPESDGPSSKCGLSRVKSGCEQSQPRRRLFDHFVGAGEQCPQANVRLPGMTAPAWIASSSSRYAGDTDCAGVPAVAMSSGVDRLVGVVDERAATRLPQPVPMCRWSGGRGGA